MKASKYFVSLGGINLHCVTSFGLSADRDIEDCDGIGSGKFNVPDAASPRKWTIECELRQNGAELSGLNTWSASELFKEFEIWRAKTDAPIRMVKTDLLYPRANLSVLVWFKSYEPKESDEQGVYDTTIEVEEYKPVGIKTTGIPAVRRSGKVPVPPKVTITKKRTVYRVKKKYGKKATLNSTKTGKPVKNDALPKGTYALKIGKATAVSTTQGAALSISTKRAQSPNSTRNVFDGLAESVSSTFKWISNGISSWFK